MIESPSRNESWRIFDRIAHRYDLLNRLLSFGRDIAWRKKVARLLPERDNLTLLDLATGTADLLFSLCENGTRIGSAVGLDMSAEMLTLAGTKLQKKQPSQPCLFLRSDAQSLPFPDRSFDVVTIAFGIRNIPDVNLALREMTRILKPGGRAIVLEFSLPRNTFVRSGYLFYFRHILPRIGGLISGDSKAYKYLNETVETFPYGRDFCDLMEQAGMNDVNSYTLTFGVATIYTGDAASPMAPDRGKSR